jgi:hypothetical protein
MSTDWALVDICWNRLALALLWGQTRLEASFWDCIIHDEKTGLMQKKTTSLAERNP